MDNREHNYHSLDWREPVSAIAPVPAMASEAIAHPAQEENPAIAEYVAQLRAQLGRMPEAQQEELYRELHQHLDLWVADHGHLEGLSPGAALGYLVREFGDPTTIGRQLAHPYHRLWRVRAWQIAGQVERCCWITNLTRDPYILSWDAS